jgi:serine/threonine protein kinase
LSLAPGTRLGPYAIEAAIGAGGMGEVYRARDTRLDRVVAIKVLPAHLSSDPGIRQRFDREARAISGLQHPHICALFDVGHEAGVDFLVMEYLEGETLADRLRKGPVATDELLRIATQIAEALDRAHRTGIVHRDLKPGNVMLTKNGVKLLDFGLARVAAPTNSSSNASTFLDATRTSGEPLTQKGTVLGTWQYMAPEQLEGGEADARSDIFALGAVLYEMATGRRAFEAKSQASLIAAIMTAQPPPISSIAPMTPPALDRVVRTCLEKDPDDRLQTAHDVALQLRWIQEGGTQLGVPRPVAARRRSRERLGWIVAGAAGVAAIALAVLQLGTRKPDPAATLRFSIPAPPGLLSVGSPRISPDGKYIAFNGSDSTGVTKLWLRPLNSLSAYSLPGTERCTRPFWSPDSRFLGFFAAGKLKKVAVGGGPVVTLGEFASGSDGSWSKEGLILFDASLQDTLHAIPAAGGDAVAVTTLDRAHGESGHAWPFFLPDGKRYLYIAYCDSERGNRIRLGTLEARNRWT